MDDIIPSHSFSRDAQGRYDRDIILSFLEERLEKFVKLVCEFTSLSKAEFVDVLSYTLVIFKQRKIISHATHSHVAINDFCSFIIKTASTEILFCFLQCKWRYRNLVSHSVM